MILRKYFYYISPEYFLNNWKWLKIKEKLSKISLIICDVDGVLTDGGLYVNNQGETLKKFDVKDGLGIKLLQSCGIEVAFVSGGSTGATEARAKTLGIKYCYVNIKDKNKAVKEIQKSLSTFKENTLFVGDDLNDLIVRRNVGLLIAPFDANKFLKKNCDAILNKSGGNGAIRELAEKLILGKEDWNETFTLGWRDRNL